MTSTGTRLDLTRSQILAFRRTGRGARRAACAGRAPRCSGRPGRGCRTACPGPRCSRSTPGSRGPNPSTWEDPSLVQLWGPRYSVFVVAECDLAVFSLGTAAGRRQGPTAGGGARRAPRRRPRRPSGCGHKEAGARLGVHPNRLRYAARDRHRPDPLGGRAAADGLDRARRRRSSPREARLELARRYLHSLRTDDARLVFARWAGIGPRTAVGGVRRLWRQSLTPVRTPIGEAWILSSRRRPRPGRAGARAAAARLLPSGDAYLPAPGGRPRAPGAGRGSPAASCGRRGSGRARCWSTARSPGRGGAPARCVTIQTLAAAVARRSATRSRRRRSRCRCPAPEGQVVVRWET